MCVKFVNIVAVLISFTFLFSNKGSLFGDMGIRLLLAVLILIPRRFVIVYLTYQ